MADYGKKGPYTNPEKNNYILEKFYEENFPKKDADLLENYKISKVNLATNDVVENLGTPTVDDYVNEVLSEDYSIISNETITLKRNQESLNLIFYCSTNYFDTSNPQKGICTGKNDEIINNLSSVNPRGKTIVIFGGDLLGEEWQLKYLRTASIQNNKALYFGLNKRKQRLINDIKKFFSLSDKILLDIDLYLMRGFQEHTIIKEIGRDIFEEAFNELKDKFVRDGVSRLHYLNTGVSVILNVEKVGRDRRKRNATIGIQTNMKNKTSTARGEVSARKNFNGQLPCDAVFVCNGNTPGKLENNTYHVSGQSQYVRTPKGKKPMYASKRYNVFSAYVEDNNEFVIQEGGNNIYPENLNIQKAVHRERKKKKCLLSTCYNIIKEKLNETIDEKEA